MKTDVISTEIKDATASKYRRSSCDKIAYGVIILNASITIVLVFSVIYMYLFVIKEHQELTQNAPKNSVHGVGEISSLQKKYALSAAHLVGHGKQVRSKHLPGDIYRVSSWKVQHISGNLTYDNNGYLTVQKDGIYFIYSQMFYFDGNNSYTGFNVYIDDRRIMKAVNSVIDEDKPYQTHYIGGVFKLNKGQRIWIGATITRIFYFNEVSSFFGAFMIQ